MKHFTSIHDVDDLNALLKEAQACKANPLQYTELGRGKCLGLLFLNPSLRTRMSAQRAALNLNLQCIVLNVNQDSWALEFEDGAVMNGNKVEHIKDAAAVLGSYCDVLAVRSFPSLTNKFADTNEIVLTQILKYAGVPVISLESATRHPLQSFADLITISENTQGKKKPKVVLTWAPHIKPLPQAVANSFAEWMLAANYDLHIAAPKELELSAEFTKGATLHTLQQTALEGADFVYVKNWSSFNNYGAMAPDSYRHWLLSEDKMEFTNSAYLMHCLPVRRNVEVPDGLLDSSKSLVLQQAANRVVAMQVVLQQLLLNN